MEIVFFYGADRRNKTLDNKVKKSDYPKDRAFLQCVNDWMKVIIGYILTKKSKK